MFNGTYLRRRGRRRPERRGADGVRVEQNKAKGETAKCEMECRRVERQTETEHGREIGRAPSVVELTNKEGNEGIDSKVSIMNQISEELRNPDVNMIELCGLGGVGKTTIAKEVAKNKKVFEKVIMATVSQKLNIEKIQD
ncbi:hypothetical protein K1719_041137 [Acacia pycnantha]|nr:hypothetical protein K1719_041137 [Acacia pycnantha]